MSPAGSFQRVLCQLMVQVGIKMLSSRDGIAQERVHAKLSPINWLFRGATPPPSTTTHLVVQPQVLLLVRLTLAAAHKILPQCLHQQRHIHPTLSRVRALLIVPPPYLCHSHRLCIPCSRREGIHPVEYPHPLSRASWLQPCRSIESTTYLCAYAFSGRFSVNTLDFIVLFVFNK